MVNPGIQTCPVCSVKIIVGAAGGDRVLFSSGPQGTRAQLWAKVCQYTNNNPGCINPQGQYPPTNSQDYSP